MIRYEIRYRTKQDFVATCKIYMGQPDTFTSQTSAYLTQDFLTDEKVRDWAECFLRQNSAFRYIISIEAINEVHREIYFKGSGNTD